MCFEMLLKSVQTKCVPGTWTSDWQCPIAHPCPRPRDVKGEAVGRAKMWPTQCSWCQCGQIADVVGRIPVSSTIHQNTQFVLYALTDRKPVERTLDWCHMITRTQCCVLKFVSRCVLITFRCWQLKKRTRQSRCRKQIRTWFIWTTLTYWLVTLLINYME